MGPAPSLPNVNLNIRSSCCVSDNNNEKDAVDGKVMVQPRRASWLLRRIKTRKSLKDDKDTSNKLAEEAIGIQSKQTDEETVSDS